MVPMGLSEAVFRRKSSYVFKNRFTVLLFIGVLSMVFAEVYSGASPLWFVNLWSLFVTFPYTGAIFYFSSRLP